MSFRLLLGVIIVAAILIYNKPFGSLGFVKKRCTATAAGHYVYAEGMYRSNGVFPLEVEVKYNPSDPEVCFVNGKRGTIVGKK